MSTEHSAIQTIQPPPSPQHNLDVTIGGAGRGARQNMPAYADFNRKSVRSKLRLILADPAPEHAASLQAVAQLDGLLARAAEARVQDVVLTQGEEFQGPIQLSLDKASAIAEVMRSTAGIRRALLIYLLIRLPSSRLWGLRLVLQPGDEAARATALAFFERLADVTERGSSGRFSVNKPILHIACSNRAFANGLPSTRN